MITLLSISVGCGALLTFAFFDIIWNTMYVFAGIHPCMYDYACACESLVKASYPLQEEYMKEIAL